MGGKPGAVALRYWGMPVWSIVFSTVVYFAVAWAVGRWLSDELGWERGRSRSMVAGLVALLASSLSAWAIDAAFPSQAVGIGSTAGMARLGGLDAEDAKRVQANIDAILAGKAGPASPSP